MDVTSPSGISSSIRHNLPQIPIRGQHTRYAVSKASSRDSEGSPSKDQPKDVINVVPLGELKHEDVKDENCDNPTDEVKEIPEDLGLKSNVEETEQLVDPPSSTPPPSPQKLISSDMKSPTEIKITPSTMNSPIKLRIRRSVNNEDQSQIVTDVSISGVGTPDSVQLPPDDEPQCVSMPEPSLSQTLAVPTLSSPEIKRPRARTKRELKRQLMERRAQIANPALQPNTVQSDNGSVEMPPHTNTDVSLPGAANPAAVPMPPRQPPPTAASVTAVDNQHMDSKFSRGDMLWGKVSGHPWWPCIVANDPFQGIFVRSSGTKKVQLHVQFFGDEDERGWVSQSAVMVYEGQEAFDQFSNIMIEKDRKNRKLYEIASRRKKAWMVAVRAADLAAKMSYEERISLYRLDYVPTEEVMEPVALAPTEEEKQAKPRKRQKSEEGGEGKFPVAKRQRRDSSPLSSSESSEPLSPLHFKLPINVEHQNIAQYTVFCSRKRESLKRMHPAYTSEQIDAILVKEWEELSGEQQSMFIPMGSDFTHLSEMMTKNMASESPPKKKPRQVKKKLSLDPPHTPSSSSKRNKSLPTPSKGVTLTSCEDVDELIETVAKGGGEVAMPDSLTLKVAAHSEVLGKARSRLSKSERELEECLLTSESECDSVKRKEESVTTFAAAVYDLELLHLSSSWPCKKEAVCHLCEEEGQLVTCEGGCYATYHASCISQDESVTSYKCPQCTSGIHRCFSCKENSSETIRCGFNHCGRFYHEHCLKENTNSRLENGSWFCPLHVCSTCMAENPKGARARQGRLFRCLRCPTAYHVGDFCIAAGSKHLAGHNIICASHFEPAKKSAKDHLLHVSWCFVCSKGGMLVCCDTCPAAFHVECLDTEPPDGPWQCNQCSDGRRPLYGDIIWVKLGPYRWWPGEICHPKNVPLNIQAKAHQVGEFPVKFLGSHDYYWTHGGRVFLYQEGDRGGKCEKVGSKNLAKLFMKAVDEASLAYTVWKEVKEEKEERDNEKSERKPPAYRSIKANIPIGSVQTYRADLGTISKCECTQDMENPCGEDSDCLNRMTLYECHPQVCPAGDKCQNQRFQMRDYPKAVPFKADSRGWGLKCMEDIRKGQFVNEYVGDLVDQEECERRIKDAHDNDVTNFYMLTLDNKRVIDAGPKGNLSRFMNHSCDPNLVTQIWTVNGDQRVGFFAIHDIPAGTELTFNYNLKSLGNEKTVCHCQASNCSGFLGVRPKSTTSDVEKAAKKEKKKKKRKSVKKNQDDDCYRCGDGGELILCDQTSCPKAYHLKCLKLKALPKGRWLCPWHHCDECGQRALRLCSECPNSFCPNHIEGNIYQMPDNALVCSDHDDLLKAVECSKLETLKNQPGAVVPVGGSSSESYSEQTSSNPPSPPELCAPFPITSAAVESSDTEKMLKLPLKSAQVSDAESTSTDASSYRPLKKVRKSPSKRRSGGLKKPAVTEVALAEPSGLAPESVSAGGDSDSSIEGRLTIVEDDLLTDKNQTQKRKRTSKGDTAPPSANHSLSPTLVSPQRKKRVPKTKSTDAKSEMVNTISLTPPAAAKKATSKKNSPATAASGEKHAANRKGKSPITAVFDDNSSDEFPDLVIDIPTM